MFWFELKGFTIFVIKNACKDLSFPEPFIIVILLNDVLETNCHLTWDLRYIGSYTTRQSGLTLGLFSINTIYECLKLKFQSQLVS